MTKMDDCRIYPPIYPDLNEAMPRKVRIVSTIIGPCINLMVS